ncbi:MAG: class I SAM-dependent methyltransferase [Candidatus Marsarchaeota archaeon]|nr:class I SAM-dependent methyltransferase [Candidatus Marsarchaeota archaeon]
MMKQYSYDRLAKYYDTLELEADWFYSKSNSFIDSALKRHKAKSVLDFTCGTGAQALYLSKSYRVVANDMSKGMLDIAKSKAKKLRVHLKFNQGDIRYARLGKFDAVITIFNAIGHLKENEFVTALQNINHNLKAHGLYIFDIFNLEYNYWALEYDFIDAALKDKENTYVRFNHNHLDSKARLLKINQETWIQKGFDRPKIIKDSWDMQIYSRTELKRLLEKNGFKILSVYGGWGKKFRKSNSLSIVVVAQKQ